MTRQPVAARSPKAVKARIPASQPFAVGTPMMRPLPPVSSIPTIVITVDETGNLGSVTRGESHFILAGCLVSDIRRFEYATHSRYKGEELKFHDQYWLRVPIIEDAKQSVDDIY